MAPKALIESAEDGEKNVPTPDTGASDKDLAKEGEKKMPTPDTGASDKDFGAGPVLPCQPVAPLVLVSPVSELSTCESRRDPNLANAVVTFESMSQLYGRLGSCSTEEQLRLHWNTLEVVLDACQPFSDAGAPSPSRKSLGQHNCPITAELTSRMRKVAIGCGTLAIIELCNHTTGLHARAEDVGPGLGMGILNSACWCCCGWVLLRSPRVLMTPAIKELLQKLHDEAGNEEATQAADWLPACLLACLRACRLPTCLRARLPACLVQPNISAALQLPLLRTQSTLATTGAPNAELSQRRAVWYSKVMLWSVGVLNFSQVVVVLFDPKPSSERLPWSGKHDPHPIANWTHQFAHEYVSDNAFMPVLGVSAVALVLFVSGVLRYSANIAFFIQHAVTTLVNRLAQKIEKHPLSEGGRQRAYDWNALEGNLLNRVALVRNVLKGAESFFTIYVVSNVLFMLAPLVVILQLYRKRFQGQTFWDAIWSLSTSNVMVMLVTMYVVLLLLFGFVEVMWTIATMNSMTQVRNKAEEHFRRRGNCMADREKMHYSSLMVAVRDLHVHSPMMRLFGFPVTRSSVLRLLLGLFMKGAVGIPVLYFLIQHSILTANKVIQHNNTSHDEH